MYNKEQKLLILRFLLIIYFEPVLQNVMLFFSHLCSVIIAGQVADLGYIKAL